LRKLISFLSFIIVVALIAGVIYLRPGFFPRQINKVHGMWNIYKGDKAYKKLKLQKAIDYYNRGVQLYPEHYNAWYNLGNIYVVYEDYYSAVDAYEKAIEHNPKFLLARMNYGIVSTERLGDFDGAIDQYKSIVETKRRLISIPFIFSNRKSTKMNRGLAYYNMGVAYKQKSIYLDNEWEFKRQYLNDALESYKKAVKILKKDYDARYNLALTYHLLGDYHDAGLTYCKAIEISPMNYEAHYNLAVLLRHLKYYKESLDEMEKATSLITNSEGITNRQRYIFDVMNDMTRIIISNTDSKYLIENVEDDPMKKVIFNSKKSGVTYVNGKLVATEALDKAIYRNFKTCSSKKLFKEDIGEDYNEYRGRARVPHTEQIEDFN